MKNENIPRAMKKIIAINPNAPFLKEVQELFLKNSGFISVGTKVSIESLINMYKVRNEINQEIKKTNPVQGIEELLVCLKNEKTGQVLDTFTIIGPDNSYIIIMKNDLNELLSIIKSTNLNSNKQEELNIRYAANKSVENNILRFNQGEIFF